MNKLLFSRRKLNIASEKKYPIYGLPKKKKNEKMSFDKYITNVNNKSYFKSDFESKVIKEYEDSDFLKGTYNLEEYKKKRKEAESKKYLGKTEKRMLAVVDGLFKKFLNKGDKNGVDRIINLKNKMDKSDENREKMYNEKKEIKEPKEAILL